MTKQARGELLTGIGWLAGWSALTVYAAAVWGYGVSGYPPACCSLGSPASVRLPCCSGTG